MRHAALTLSLGSCLVACSGAPADAPPPADGAVAADGGGGEGGGDLATGGAADLASPPDLAPACSGRPPEAPGTSMRTLRFGNLNRGYLLRVPAGYDASRPTPLVLGFHGFTDSATNFTNGTGLGAAADRRGYLYAAPQGSGLLPSWNAGACCGEASGLKVDDTGFIKALLDELARGFCLDAKRVYVTGFSNGAFFTNRLGCELADRVAAIAPVSGGLVFSPCAPARPLPYLTFHGTADTVVGYNGNQGLRFPSAQQNLEDWARRNGCTGAATVTFQMGATRCDSYAQCGGGATTTLCTLTGEDHSWPDGKFGIVATPTILDFFARFSLP